MMLIEGIIGSIRSMFWLSILLSILVYTVAIVFVKFIGKSEAYEDDEFDADYYFGDMVAACMTGLNLALMTDWTYVVRPILKRQPFVAGAIMIYVGVSCFGIMNAIIGVIVTRTSAAAAEAEAEDRLQFQNRQMAFVESMKDIIYEIDTDGDGTVSPQEMADASEHEELLEALASCDLPVGFSALELHCMLDKDGDGELSKFEFQQGMRRLIFSNEFQRQCLLSLAIAQQKRKMCVLKQDMSEGFRKINDKLIDLPHIFAEIIKTGEVPSSYSPKDSPKGARHSTGSLRTSVRNSQHGKGMANVVKRVMMESSDDAAGDMNVADLPGYIGDDKSTNGKLLDKGSPKPTDIHQTLQQAGTVAGTTAQVSQAVFLEVSKALSQAAKNWAPDDRQGHNMRPNQMQSPMGAFSPMRPMPNNAMAMTMPNMYGGPRQAAQPDGNMQHSMIGNQMNMHNQPPHFNGAPNHMNTMHNQMPNQQVHSGVPNLMPNQQFANSHNMMPTQPPNGMQSTGNQWQHSQMPNQQHTPPQQQPAVAPGNLATSPASKVQANPASPGPGAAGRGRGRGVPSSVV
jgi:hypothetical protein